jgi:hypothetical protein
MRTFLKAPSWSRFRPTSIAFSVLMAEFTSFSTADYPEPGIFFEELDCFPGAASEVIALCR